MFIINDLCYITVQKLVSAGRITGLPGTELPVWVVKWLGKECLAVKTERPGFRPADPLRTH
jgi:hypothetical protein